MKRYIFYGLALIMAFPLYASAQDESTDDDGQNDLQTVVKYTQKSYETRKVSGLVLDAATGKPVAGVIVKAAGLEGYSALTNDFGYFMMQVPVFTSSLYLQNPSYNSVTLGLAKGEKQRTVKLLSKAFKDDYKTENPNVMNSESANDFQYSNALNISEEVQKQLGAYAYTTQRSGTPGIGSTVFIQGLNSLNSNAQPLVVVDGVIMDQQYSRTMTHQGFYNDMLSCINPADIENVNILRNGTALYGARGANGVIEITTKRAQSLATRITASISAGVTFEPKYYSMMDAEQYRSYASELIKGTGSTIKSFKFLSTDPNYYYYNQYHNNTDWKDEIYRNALTQNYGIKVEGGDNTAKYNLSVGYTAANSTLEYNNMNRLNVRFNTDIQLLDKLGVKFDASFANITRDIRDDGAPTTYDEGTPTSPSFLAYVKSPFLSQYSYGNGQLSTSFLDITEESYLDEVLSGMSGNYNYKLGNPVAINEYSEAPEKNRFENSLLNIAVTPKYEFNRHLSIYEHFSYSLVNTKDKYYLPYNGTPMFYVSSVTGWRSNLCSSLSAKQNSLSSDTRLDWNNRFGAHSVSAFAGVRMNFETYSSSMQQGYNTGSDKTPLISNATANQTTTGVDESWRNMDMYLQANYNYLGRYFAQFNLTASGSSRFGSEADGLKLFGVRWGVFPSLQASWVMTNEPWFANVDGIDYLRLTAGYDISGNDDIDVYANRSYYVSSTYLNKITGYVLEGIGNTNIKWETTRRFNAGVEMRIVNNRVGLAFNFFHSRTSDLLALQELSMLSGIESNWANTGKLQNQGFDFNVNGKLIAAKNWSWELGASVGHYENKILSLGLSDGRTGYTTSIYNAEILTQEGKAANLFYGYATKGVFSTTAEAEAAGLYILDDNGVDKKYFGAGDVIFDDVNGDHEINEKDKVVIGDPNPDIYGNIFTSLTYKRLKLDVNFSYSLGNDVYNYMRQQLESGSRFMNQTTALTNRWQAEGQITDVPQITFQDPMGNSRCSDRWIEDGSYLKLKSVTLSYDLPINSTFLQGLQFWIQANNLFTLTHYLGTDPEFSVTNSVIGQGIDYGRLGQGRSILAGVKINL